MGYIYRLAGACFSAALLSSCIGGTSFSPTSGLSQQNGTSSAQYKLLYRFQGDPDGSWPYAGVVLIGNKLYGTTSRGGDGCPASGPGSQCGIVFAVNSSTGSEKVVYNFEGRTGGNQDSANPRGGLVYYRGNFYGTTNGGGSPYTSGSGSVYHYGTVYNVTKYGSEHVLYSFKGGTDGEYPNSTLIAVNGKFYGTTEAGGSWVPYGYGNGYGTVFEFDPSTNQERVLYAFTGITGRDGSDPTTQLTFAGNKLYGTTVYGGYAGSSCPVYYGCGIVFSLGLSSGKYKIIHRFHGTDGRGPGGVTAFKSSLLGTTFNGGCCGLVYSIDTKTDKETILYSFSGYSKGDGVGPGYNQSPIVLNGYLYGTTLGGGTGNDGTVWRLNLSSKEETVLYSFKGGSDGNYPQATLMFANGELYGTTFYGGGSTSSYCVGGSESGCGTVFELTPPS